MALKSSIEEVIAEVERWFDEHLRRAPLAHHVEAYNQVHAAHQDLKARLTALLTGNAPAPIAAASGAAAEPKAEGTATEA